VKILLAILLATGILMPKVSLAVAAMLGTG